MTKRLLILFSTATLLLFNAAIAQVTVSTDWNLPKGEVKSDLWSVNDYEIMYGDTDRPADRAFNDYLEEIQPGIIRIHNAALVWEWTDSETKTWDREKIKQGFAKAYGFKGSKLLLNISHWPSFIHDGDILPLDKKQALIDLLLDLQTLLKEENIKVDYWEVLNENDNKYEQAGKLPELWSLLKDIMVALKAADPNTKVGGPALTWPKQIWVDGFLDECGGVIDFMSWHNYASGDPSTSNQDVVNAIGTLENHAKTVMDALKKRNIIGIETFLSEFNVQWTWTPYEKRHHNHVGAVFQAGVIHRMSKLGVDGAFAWHAKGNSYGLLRADNEVSAPGHVYKWGQRYLTGNEYTSTATDNAIETWSIGNGANRSTLILNKSAETKKLNTANILGASNTNDVRILQINSSGYKPEPMTLADQIDLKPYSVTLITDKEAPKLGTIESLKTGYRLDKSIQLKWDRVRGSQGYQVFVDGVLNVTSSDTVVTIDGLTKNTTYDIEVYFLDESSMPQGKAELTSSTRGLPLLIDDQNTGSALHQMQYSGDWRSNAYSNAYNRSYLSTSKKNETITIQFDGDQIALTAFKKPDGGKASISIDGDEKGTIDFAGTDLKTLVWTYEGLTNGTHTVVIKNISDGSKTITIDNFYVFNASFADDSQAPEVPANLTFTSTVKSAAVSWDIPSDDNGVQGYEVKVNNVSYPTRYDNSIILDNLEAGTVYLVKVRAFDPAGNRSEYSAELEVTTAEVVYQPISKTANAPEIDGEIDTVWAKSAIYKIENMAGTAPADAADFSGTFRALWDQNYVYFLLNVKDDNITAKAGETSYENADSFEFFFDTNNDKDAIYGDDDFWFSFAAEDGSYIDPYGNNKFPFAKVVKTTDGYTAEMRVKWSGLKWYTAASGGVFGLDVHLNDNDGGAERETKKYWADGSENAKSNPSFFNTMVLVDTATYVDENVLATADTEAKLSVFPVPAAEMLNIQSETRISEIVIFNQLGVVISRQKVQDTKAEINLRGLPSGLYFAAVHSLNGSKTVPFIKR